MENLLKEVLMASIEKDVSDIHFSVGSPVLFRIHGVLEPYNDKKLSPKETEEISKLILSETQQKTFDETGSVDLSYSINKGSRFRINIYKQRGSYAIAARVLGEKIPTFEDFNLPSVIKELTTLKRGLVLVTGPTGSGKSTTLAAMVDYMNKHRKDHIITIEDPIEFMHKHNSCLINQRELGEDTISFSNALRGALRQDPDIILVGEMRDLATIEIGVTAAETGHLVLGTLHTISAAETVERIVDVFQPEQQGQIKAQLANVLQAVISQQLLPTETGRVGAYEIMLKIPAISNLIMQGKTSGMNNTITTNRRLGMITMDTSIKQLFASGMISYDVAIKFAVDKKNMEKSLKVYE